MPRRASRGRTYKRIYPKIDAVGAAEDSGNISYESDHDMLTSDSEIDDAPRSGSTYIRTSTPKSGDSASMGSLDILAFLFVLLMALIYAVLPDKQTSEEKLHRYLRYAGKMLKENYTREFAEGSHTREILRLAGEKWIGQEPKEPYVLLITGTVADQFAIDLVAVFSNATQRGEVDSIYCSGDTERHVLDTEISKSLSKRSNTVILHGIDKLLGDSALALHSLCDPDHSPHKTALILLTINKSLGTYPSCEMNIQRHLLEEWRSEYMNEDRVPPILSRITSYVICLQS